MVTKFWNALFVWGGHDVRHSGCDQLGRCGGDGPPADRRHPASRRHHRSRRLAGQQTPRCARGACASWMRGMARSRRPLSTDAFWSRSTAKSTTTPNCAMSWKQLGIASAPKSTPKSSPMRCRSGARRPSSAWSACMPSSLSTPRPANFLPPAIPFGVKPLYLIQSRRQLPVLLGNQAAAGGDAEGDVSCCCRRDIC